MQSCTELETCRFTLIRFLIFRFRPVPLVFIWSAMELISCVIHLFYLWRPVFVTQLLPLNLPPPPPLFLLLLTCLCAGLLLSPLGDSRLQLVCACVCACVCVRATASGGGGSRLNPSSLLATERFGAGQGEAQGMGAGCTVTGESKVLWDYKDGGKEERRRRRVRVLLCCCRLGMLTCLLCALERHVAEETKYLQLCSTAVLLRDASALPGRHIYCA